MNFSECILHILYCWVPEVFFILVLDFVTKQALQFAEDQEEKCLIWQWEIGVIFLFALLIWKYSHLPIMLFIIGVTLLVSVIWKEMKSYFKKQQKGTVLPHSNLISPGEHNLNKSLNCSTKTVKNFHFSEFPQDNACATQLVRRKSIWDRQNYLFSKTNERQTITSVESKDTPIKKINPKVLAATRSKFVFPKPPPSAPAGLFNQGNMCFINSSLQCLACGPYFVENLTAISSFPLNITASEAAFLQSLVALLAKLGHSIHQKAHNIEEFRLACSVMNPRLVAATIEEMEQQDVSEFIQFVFSTLEHILNKNKQTIEDASHFGLYLNTNLAQLKISLGNPSPQTASILRDQCMQKITQGVNVAEHILKLSELEWLKEKSSCNNLIKDLFVGQYVVVSYNNGNILSVTTGIMNNLYVPIVGSKDNSPASIESCITRYCNQNLGPQKVPKSSMFRKPSLKQGLSNTLVTSGTECLGGHWTEPSLTKEGFSLGQQQNEPEQKIFLNRLPKCLIIQLMRYNVFEGVAYKISNSISINRDNLDMTQFMLSRAENFMPRTNRYVYELYGLCVHLGAERISSGHYVSYGCHGDKWFRMDDDIVTEVDIDSCFHSNEIQQNAYLLFYKQKLT